MQANKLQYEAVTGEAQIYDGTLVPIIRAHCNGMIVRTITIKAPGNSRLGKIEFYLQKDKQTILWQEVVTPSKIQYPTIKAYQKTFNVSLCMQAGYVLLAALNGQKGDLYNIIAEGVCFTNCPCE